MVLPKADSFAAVSRDFFFFLFTVRMASEYIQLSFYKIDAFLSFYSLPEEIFHPLRNVDMFSEFFYVQQYEREKKMFRFNFKRSIIFLKSYIKQMLIE